VANEAATWLEIAAVCDRFHVLPRPGGVMNQESYEMRRLLKALQALDEKQAEDMDKDMSQVGGR
jgi:hypothetical protein